MFPCICIIISFASIFLNFSISAFSAADACPLIFLKTQFFISSSTPSSAIARVFTSTFSSTLISHFWISSSVIDFNLTSAGILSPLAISLYLNTQPGSLVITTPACFYPARPALLQEFQVPYILYPLPAGACGFLSAWPVFVVLEKIKIVFLKKKKCVVASGGILFFYEETYRPAEKKKTPPQIEER